MNNKYFIALAILILITATFFIFGNKKPDYLKPTAGQNIIVFGDSLAFGQGSTAGNDVSSLLAKKTGLSVINAGVNGATTTSALPRLEKDVLSKNPKVVIILLGGNDFFQRIPSDTVMTNLETLVDRILATGSGVILVNENKIFATRPLFKDLAKNKQIPYIEHVLDGIIDDKSLMSDTIHPNDKGYEVMSEKIKEVLLEYLE